MVASLSREMHFVRGIYLWDCWFDLWYLVFVRKAATWSCPPANWRFCAVGHIISIFITYVYFLPYLLGVRLVGESLRPWCWYHVGH